MMNVNLPYTEVWIKKSFLMGPSNFKTEKDETVFGILMSFKAIHDSAPLFEVYLPEYGACYDKVLQCAIFNRKETPEENISLSDVAYWDCLSDDAELHVKSLMMDVSLEAQTGKVFTGRYLWTIDWRPNDDYLGVAQVWNEHKQKNFFFDRQSGVLCCGPNNKMRWFANSLTPQELKKPFFKVFSGNHTHEEFESTRLGESTNWDYTK